VLGLSAKDVFCLHETRVVNGYRRISLFRHDIAVPNVPLHEQVDVHLIPDSTSQTVEVRIWWNDSLSWVVYAPATAALYFLPLLQEKVATSSALTAASNATPALRAVAVASATGIRSRIESHENN